MVIKNLKLKNYRRFRNLELELPENIIGVLGNNGVGKTTIVESIGWCLYGNRIRRSDKQDIRSQFCENFDECSVQLEFVFGGNEYRLLRKLKGKNSAVEAAIYLGSKSEPEAVQERGVNDYIENLLNLDYRSFFISVFARQKDLAALSMFQPEERRKSIARLIDIDSIDRARNEVRSDRKSKSDQRSGMSASLKDEKELKQTDKNLKLVLNETQTTQLEQKNKLVESQHKFLEIKTEFEKLGQVRDLHFQIQARIDKWNSLLEEAQVRKKKHDEQLKLIEQANEELKKITPQLNDYSATQKEKERLDKASSKYFQLQALGDEKKRLQQRITRQQFNITKLTEELKGYENINENLAGKSQAIKELEKERETMRQELSKKEGAIINVKSKGKEARQKKENIEKLGADSPCPICTRPLKEHFEPVKTSFEKELTELRQQYRGLEQSGNELKDKIGKIDAQLENEKNSRDGLLQAQEQFKEKNKQLFQEKEELTDLDLNLKDVNKKIAEIGKIEYDEKKHKESQKRFKELTALREQSLKHEENVKRLDDEKREKEKIKQSLLKLEAEIKLERQNLQALNFDDKHYLAEKQRVEDELQKIESAKDLLHQTERQLLSIKKDLEQVAAELKTNKDIKSQLNPLTEEIVYLEALDSHLGVFRQELAGRIRPLIAARGSELLQLTTQGRYSLMELDEDYNIYLYDQTEKFPLVRFSGGEQDLANLCLRIAISQVVAGRSGGTRINFIVLDEIFGSQDEQRKGLIMTALQQLCTQFRQIFIITHVEGIKDTLPVIVSVEEESDMESRAILV